MISYVDLNREPDAVAPLRDNKSKSMGCWCCVSGSMQCDVDIPRSGYVPGESIPLMFVIHNNSRSLANEVPSFFEVIIFQCCFLEMDRKVIYTHQSVIMEFSGQSEIG